jgi:hypothetical protein
MSYDLYLYKRSDSQLSEEKIIEYIANKIPHISRDENSNWNYFNPETEVHFSISKAEPDSENDEPVDLYYGFLDTGFYFSINYFRSPDFGLEIFPYLEEMIRDLDLYVLNLQTNDDEERPHRYLRDELRLDWEKQNNLVMQAHRSSEERKAAPRGNVSKPMSGIEFPLKPKIKRETDIDKLSSGNKGTIAKYGFIALMAVISIITGILDNDDDEEEAVYVPDSAYVFVDKLDDMGYFKYADSVNIDTLKQDMIMFYNPESYLTTIWDDSTYIPLDYRLYFCDNEYVSEGGGIVGMIEEMKPTFERMGAKMTIDYNISEYDMENNWLNHKISINGNEYELFKNFTGTGWGHAVKKLAWVVNKELTAQGIKDRVYLINGGNDGMLVFLTPQQYLYIYSNYSNPYWKPLQVYEWARVMEVE